MSVCFLCNSEFSLPVHPSKREKLIYFENENGNNEYMCQDCFEERAFSNDRYSNGELLCSTYGCPRNASILTKYCYKCVNEVE